MRNGLIFCGSDAAGFAGAAWAVELADAAWWALILCCTLLIATATLANRAK
jgi:hypothetical protein